MRYNRMNVRGIVQRFIERNIFIHQHLFLELLVKLDEM